MATSTAATSSELLAEIASKGEGDTVYIAPGNYDLTATISKTGGMPNLVASGATPVFRYWKTYSWTSSSGQHYCTPDKAGGSYAWHEIPNGVWAPDGTPYLQCDAGWQPYDMASPPGNNQFDVTSAFRTPDSSSAFEVLCHVRHEIITRKASFSSLLVSTTDMTGGTDLDMFDWQTDGGMAGYHKLASIHGYKIMGRSADMRPGTWRWDWANNRLYVMLRPGDTANELRVARGIRQGVSVRYSNNFRIENIIFEGLNGHAHWGPVGFEDDGSIYIRSCQNVVIDRVVTRSSAGSGIRGATLDVNDANSNLVLRNCSSFYVGSQGMSVSGLNARMESCSVLKCALRVPSAPAFVFERVISPIATDLMAEECRGGSWHFSMVNADVTEGLEFENLTAINCMTEDIGDRGNFYMIGRKGQGGVAGLLKSGKNLRIITGRDTGRGNIEVYFDEGSYGTLSNAIIRSANGSALGRFGDTPTLAGDHASGRTVFFNNPDGPTTFNGGSMSSPGLVTVESRTSSAQCTLNGTLVSAPGGLVTAGNVVYV